MKAFTNISKFLHLLILQVFLTCSAKAQITSYFSTACFNTPQNQAFIETYLTIVGNSIASKETDNTFQNSVSVQLKIISDTGLIYSKKYNVLSAIFTNSLEAPSFIDVERYPVPNGNYVVQIILTDNNNLQKKSVAHTNKIKVDYHTSEIDASSIELLESYTKSDKRGTLNKSGYDLIPYTINYYPESMSQLCFYFESYHSDTVLGKEKYFIYEYYLENTQTLKRLTNFGSFRKQKTMPVNPLLAKIDISKLASGNYNLVIELKDENNLMHLQEKLFFQRLNNIKEEIIPIKKSEPQNITEFFRAIKGADTLKVYVECLWPIASGLDKDRLINQSVKKDVVQMQNFAIDFWQRRAADTANPLKMWSTYLKAVEEVQVLFKCGKQNGYYTDRGRVYLQYGKPNQRSIQNYEANTYPYEIWQYYHATDGNSGKSYNNRKYVFVNKALGDYCYTLIHSDMPGELNNPRWQYELNRRNSEGKENQENTTPAGSQFNQFNEIYENPR